VAENKSLYVIDLKDAFSPKIKRADASFNKFDNSVKKGTSKQGGIGGFASMMSGGVLAGGLVALAAGAVLAGKEIISLGASMEQTRVEFEVLLGSKGASKQMIENLNEFANVTPFVNDALLDSTKKLLNFKFSQEKVLPILKMLGDVAGGNKEKLDGLTTAFARTSANGRLMGMELDMMIDRGFNPLNNISKKTGKSILELRKDMSKGLITFDQVQDAFITATSEGGQYFNMMDKQSKTFSGLTSTIKGKLGLMFTTMGEGFTNSLKPLLEGFVAFLDMLPRLNLKPLADSFRMVKNIYIEMLSPFKEFFGGLDANLTLLELFQLGINRLAVLMRVGLTPFRLMAAAVSFLSQPFEDIVKDLEPVVDAFKGLGNLMFGVVSFNPAMIAKGVSQFKTGFGKIASGVKDLATKELEAYRDIFATGLKGETGKGFDMAALTDVSLLRGAGGAKGAGGPGAKGTKRSSIAGISSGGVKNVELNIDKLIEQINFNNTNIKEDFDTLKEQVTRILVEASTDATRLIGT